MPYSFPTITLGLSLSSLEEQQGCHNRSNSLQKRREICQNSKVTGYWQVSKWRIWICLVLYWYYDTKGNMARLSFIHSFRHRLFFSYDTSMLQVWYSLQTSNQKRVFSVKALMPDNTFKVFGDKRAEDYNKKATVWQATVENPHHRAAGGMLVELRPRYVKPLTFYTVTFISLYLPIHWMPLKPQKHFCLLNIFRCLKASVSVVLGTRDNKCNPDLSSI